MFSKAQFICVVSPCSYARVGRCVVSCDVDALLRFPSTATSCVMCAEFALLIGSSRFPFAAPLAVFDSA